MNQIDNILTALTWVSVEEIVYGGVISLAQKIHLEQLLVPTKSGRFLFNLQPADSMKVYDNKNMAHQDNFKIKKAVPLWHTPLTIVFLTDSLWGQENDPFKKQ